jgi:hypothetical protein
MVPHGWVEGRAKDNLEPDPGEPGVNLTG